MGKTVYDNETYRRCLWDKLQMSMKQTVDVHRTNCKMSSMQTLDVYGTNCRMPLRQTLDVYGTNC
jgi:hypothetical protein